MTPKLLLGALSAAVLLVCAGVPMARAFPAASFVYPLMDARVSSGFGNRRHPVLKAVKHHSGIDLAAPQGAPIRALKGGVVVFADPYSAYGNLIVIKHSEDLTTHYGHLDSFKVAPGEHVKAGQVIGTVGATGRVTGPHLHLEVRRGGKAVDPRGFLPGLETEALG